MKSLRWNARPTHAVSALAALAIIAIVVSTVLLLWNLRKRELTHTSLEAVSVTRMLMEATQQSFESTDVLLRSVQERLQSQYGSQFPLDSAPIRLLLSSRIFGVRHLDSLFIADAEGWVLNSSEDSSSKRSSVLEREYFKAARGSKADELFIGKPERDAIDQTWTIHFARRFTDPQGRFRGIVVAAVSTAHFEALFSLLKLDYERPVALLTSEGLLVASHPLREGMIGQPLAGFNEGLVKTHSNEVMMGLRSPRRGQEERFTIGSVRGFPFLISVTNETQEALESWRDTAIPLASGAVLVILVIGGVAMLLLIELTREERLARALGEAHERYYQTVDSVMDAIVAVDEAHNILLFNPAAERMFGFSAKELIGKPLSVLLPQALRGRHDQHVRNFSHQAPGSRGMAPHLEVTGRRADGVEFPIESTISHTKIGGKQQLTAVLRDVTERRRAENELRQMNQQLRGLSTSLQNVREQERYRIAHELHDELGQQLTGLKLDLSWLSSRIKEGREVTGDKVDEMRHMLDVAIASVRRISTELRPLILDDLGFGEALAWQTREFGRRSGIDVSLHLEAEDRVSDAALATALYRIVQESLTNIVRHAGATRAEIKLVAQGDGVKLTVHDNGVGMADEKKLAGFGLLSMRERASALGGHFQIMSERGTGTTIEVIMPLSKPAEEEA